MLTSKYTPRGISNHEYMEMTRNSAQNAARQLDTLFDKKTGKNITLYYCIHCQYIMPPEYVKRK